ncbi:MAG: serine/threonine protein kinase [Bacteroidales bacterium]|nr:serine/threonine protein kinase [Lachnoclostridium sp.]MCM1383165.1 serine/threonine protein kinase [Lachnoclostridium sp.]MCM1464609.1 serine/threonine protein kinase [Bacteroidales bacterium]
MNLWTSEEIAKILMQLDERKLPFDRYSFVSESGRLKLLGRGGSAEVYEAQARFSHKPDYAIKVIGFQKQNEDSALFKEAVQAQKDIRIYQETVVKIYDCAELWVSLDEKGGIVKAAKEEPEELSQTSIKLQFVVMEKLSPVIEKTKDGRINITPPKLALGDEGEALKLAYDIGLALQRAHNHNILHRDVKLENVFYSEKQKLYKLGDFGIAKKTDDGFANTVVFTKGYAAPEVRISGSRYDNTADIYSLGMMLYVLMNHLKFPDSGAYQVNSGAQYSPGYIVPCPDGDISEDFYFVIAKACMYDPDGRYQSMKDMILDIEKLMYSESLGYKKEHKRVSLAVGSVMLALGVAAWKLTLVPQMVIRLTLWQYIFLAGCLGKGILKILKRESSFVNLIVSGVGIYLLISSGFSWLKLLLLLWMIVSSGATSGYFAAGVLIADFVSIMQRESGADWGIYREYSWAAIAVISFGIVLLYQYGILTIENRTTARVTYQKGLYWILVCLIYGCWILQGTMLEIMTSSAERWYRSMLGNRVVDAMQSVDLKMAGALGLGLSLFWILREKILIRYQRFQTEKYNGEE